MLSVVYSKCMGLKWRMKECELMLSFAIETDYFSLKLNTLLNGSGFAVQVCNL